MRRLKKVATMLAAVMLIGCEAPSPPDAAIPGDSVQVRLPNQSAGAEFTVVNCEVRGDPDGVEARARAYRDAVIERGREVTDGFAGFERLAIATQAEFGCSYGEQERPEAQEFTFALDGVGPRSRTVQAFRQASVTCFGPDAATNAAAAVQYGLATQDAYWIQLEEIYASARNGNSDLATQMQDLETREGDWTRRLGDEVRERFNCRTLFIRR